MAIDESSLLSLLHKEMKGEYTDMIFLSCPDEWQESSICKLKQETIRNYVDRLDFYDAFNQIMEEVRHACPKCHISQETPRTHICPAALYLLSEFMDKDENDCFKPELTFQHLKKASLMNYAKASARIGEKYFHGEATEVDEWKGLAALGSIAIYQGFEKEAARLIQLLEECACIPESYQIPFVARLANAGDEEMIHKLVRYHLKNIKTKKCPANLIDPFIKHLLDDLDTLAPISIETLTLILPLYYDLQQWEMALLISDKLFDLTGDVTYQKKSKELELKLLGMDSSNPIVVVKKGFIFLYGRDMNHKLALKYFQYGIDQNISLAFYGMGLCYINGLGVKCDRGEGIRNFLRAIDFEDNDCNLRAYFWLLKHAEEVKSYQPEPNLFTRPILPKEFYQTLELQFDKDQEEAYLLKGRLMVTGEFDLYLRNNAEAMTYLAKVWKNGYTEAALWLASLYPSMEVECLRAGARKYDATCLYKLGTLYNTGRGVDKDLQKAYECFKASAERGNADAKFELTRLYESELDQLTRHEYLTAAAHEGNLEAMLSLTTAYWDEHNFGMVCYWGQKAIDGGVKSLRFEVAYSYAELNQPEKAKELYLSLAEENDRVALNNLGCLEADKTKSFEYFLKSAQLGAAVGSYNCARYYLYGIGTTKDIETAIEWFQKSANPGYYSAIMKLADLYQGNDGIEADFEAVEKWMEKGMSQNRKSTLIPYSRFLIFKKKGDEDIKRAESMLQELIAYGYQDDESKKRYGEGCRLLGYIKEFHTPNTTSNSEAVYWYRNGAKVGDGGCMTRLRDLNVNWINEEGEIVEETTII